MRDLRPLLTEPVAVVGVPLCLWALVLPWVAGLEDDHAAIAAHISFTMAFLPLALLGAGLPVASLLTAGGGLWLASSPWVLGYADSGIEGWAPDLVTGVLLAVCALASLRSWRGRLAAGPQPHLRE